MKRRYNGQQIWKIFLLTFLCIGFSSVESAPEKLPLPRYVSLRSNRVNIHVGPGKTYPIDWTFTRQDLPVEIIAEFDTWRQIRESQGTTGWVHKSLLSGKRTVLIKGKKGTTFKLHSKPDENASVLALLNANVIGKVKECRQAWCRIDVHHYSGWVKRDHLWGVYPREEKF